MPDVQNDNTYDLNDREYSNFNSSGQDNGNSGFLDLTNNDGGLFGFGYHPGAVTTTATRQQFWATGGGLRYEPGILQNT